MFQTETDDLYWEQDEPGPNQVIYDLENDQVIIPNSEDEVTVTPTIRPKQVISTNVSNSQHRRFR